MKSVSGKEIVIPVAQFVLGGAVESVGTINIIEENRCVIGKTEFFHFKIKKEIFLCEVVDQSRTKLKKPRKVNPASKLNESFGNKQKIDDGKGLSYPTKEEKTWAEYKKENKARRRDKKVMDFLADL